MRKYKPGKLVASMDELVAQDFVYWRDKITPRGWFMSWQIQMASKAIQNCVIRTAEKVEVDNGNTGE